MEDKILKKLKIMINNDNISLDDMYNFANENDLTDCIYTQESLKDFVIDGIKNDKGCLAQLLQDIEDNSYYNYFSFDWSCWGQGATPIEDKQELYDYIYG
jgi:hypothetical protein|nr:MAG TPA: hypothetical protein [Bacteriophage sp.]